MTGEKVSGAFVKRYDKNLATKLRALRELTHPSIFGDRRPFGVRVSSAPRRGGEASPIRLVPRDSSVSTLASASRPQGIEERATPCETSARERSAGHEDGVPMEARRG